MCALIQKKQYDRLSLNDLVERKIQQLKLSKSSPCIAKKNVKKKLFKSNNENQFNFSLLTLEYIALTDNIQDLELTFRTLRNYKKYSILCNVIIEKIAMLQLKESNSL